MCDWKVDRDSLVPLMLLSQPLKDRHADVNECPHTNITSETTWMSGIYPTDTLHSSFVLKWLVGLVNVPRLK